MHICDLVTEENFKFSNHTVCTDWEFCCFAVHTVESRHWLRVLRVTVGPVRSKKSDITLAYWWSCKDSSWRMVWGQVIWCTFAPREFSQGDVSGDFSRWKPPSTFAPPPSPGHTVPPCNDGASVCTPDHKFWRLWGRLALLFAAWFQAASDTKTEWWFPDHLSILATTDQIRWVSCSFCMHILEIFFCIFFKTNNQIRSIYVEKDQIWNFVKKKDPLERSENWWFVISAVLFLPKSLQFSI